MKTKWLFHAFLEPYPNIFSTATQRESYSKNDHEQLCNKLDDFENGLGQEDKQHLARLARNIHVPDAVDAVRNALDANSTQLRIASLQCRENGFGFYFL